MGGKTGGGVRIKHLWMKVQKKNDLDPKKMGGKQIFIGLEIKKSGRKFF